MCEKLKPVLGVLHSFCLLQPHRCFCFVSGVFFFTLLEPFKNPLQNSAQGSSELFAEVVSSVFFVGVQPRPYEFRNDKYHPVWGAVETHAVGSEKRMQLLLMLSQHETDRLEVWAQPTNSKYSSGGFRTKISSDGWIEYARPALSVDPCIALSSASRFRTNPHLKAEVTQADSRL
ncbi:hypothetical protein NL676_039882 [Syzygium grande]|nr:hypothetical protein NL676_039882 [Syzygium grande]